MNSEIYVMRGLLALENQDPAKAMAMFGKSDMRMARMLLDATKKRLQETVAGADRFLAAFVKKYRLDSTRVTAGISAPEMPFSAKYLPAFRSDLRTFSAKYGKASKDMAEKVETLGKWSRTWQAAQRDRGQ